MKTNIHLKKFQEEDFDLYFELVNDEKVMEMITERALQYEEAKTRFDKLIENNQLNENFGSYKILNAETGEFLGFVKLTLQDKNSNEAEIGYMILPKHQGKGIAGKAAGLLIEKAKHEKLIQKIFAITDPKNSVSKKILTNHHFISIGFKDFEGLPGEILELKLKDYPENK